MDRVNRILNHKKFKLYLHMNKELEKERNFCHHDINHFLDVARIAYIINLEKSLNLDKDVIYGAALLHDIGKWKQYKEGVPHEEASAELAENILRQCWYDEKSIIEITKAIKNHRHKTNSQGNLSEIIFESDKMSRSCFDCMVVSECKWVENKKNYIIKY